jgi:ATP-dependent Lon protease
MFSNYTPTKIAQIINEHWIPRDITMVALNEEELKLVEDVLSKHHLKKY